MGFVKSFAKTVSDIVDVELQVLPALIGGLVTGGAGGLLTAGLLSGAQTVLGTIKKESFEGEGLSIEQSRAINFLRAQQGLPLIGRFGQEIDEDSFVSVIIREDIDQARKAASLSTRGVGIGSPLPDVNRALLVDNPFLTSGASNLTARIPDTTTQSARPPTGGGLVVDVTPGGALRSRSAPPNQRGVSSPGTPLSTEVPMGFFETLGDRLLAGGAGILEGFASGGVTGGLAQAGLALVGGAPKGFGGVPPRIARSQAETRGMVARIVPASFSPGVLGQAISPSRPPTGGFTSLQQFDRTIGRTRAGVRGLGIGGIVAESVLSGVPPVGGARFTVPQIPGRIGPFPAGPLPPPPRRVPRGSRVRSTSSAAARRGDDRASSNGVSISPSTERRFRHGRSFQFREG